MDDPYKDLYAGHEKLYEELQRLVQGLDDAKRKRLSRHFGCSIVWPARLANGVAKPLPRMAQHILDYIKKELS